MWQCMDLTSSSLDSSRKGCAHEVSQHSRTLTDQDMPQTGACNMICSTCEEAQLEHVLPHFRVIGVEQVHVKAPSRKWFPVNEGAKLPKSGMFRLFRPKSCMLWFVCFCFFFFCFFASSSSIIAFVAATQLCRSTIPTNTPCGVRYVACHVQVALLLWFLGPPWCQWCSDRCALGCSAAVAFGCVLFVARLWLVEVIAAVPHGVSCFLSCRVGGYFVVR